MADAVDRGRIAETEPLLRPHVRKTPILSVDAADFGLPQGSVTFKLELFQHAGSFKTRGAFANLLLRQVPPVGVVAASGGNHGIAVAYAARTLGVPAKIFVPRVSSAAKIERIREMGADLVIEGERYDDALAASRRWIEQSGAMPVHAFDQVETLLGAGTVGLELERQAEALDTILVAVGGGGLIGGIAASYEGKARIIAVEPEGAPTLARAFEAGEPVDAPAGSIAADSLAPARVGALMFPIARRFIERVVLVTDGEIRDAQRALWKTLRVVAEPGGATAFAALRSGRYPRGPGERVGVVVSGGNTVAVDFTRQA